MVLTTSSASQKPGTYKVVHSLNHSVREPVPDGHIYRINTGAPLPIGTDAVIMVEDTRLHSELAPGEQGQDVSEENEVTTLAMVDPGENIRGRGSDVEEGDVVMESGDIIGNTGGDIEAIAFVGCRMVSCS
jgi:gephyrin